MRTYFATSVGSIVVTVARIPARPHYEPRLKTLRIYCRHKHNEHDDDVGSKCNFNGR